MEKIVRRFKIDYQLDWTYGVEIKKIREDLDAIEKLGATHVEIESESSYGASYVIIEPMSERIETDEECKYRIEETNKRQEEIRRRELEALNRLKEKYNQ